MRRVVSWVALLALVNPGNELRALDEETRLPEFAINSSVTIEVEPAEAATGTRWQIALGVDGNGDPIIDEGAWRLSGETQDGLLPGAHMVAFRAAREWAEPNPRSIHVVGGHVSHTEELLPLVVYDSIDDVPPLAATSGRAVRFLIESPAFVVDYEPNTHHPSGLRDIEIAEGIFRYRPSIEERQQFLLTLGNDVGDQVIVTVSPRNEPFAEQDVFRYQTEAPPNPEAPAYLLVTKNTEHRAYFNHEEQDVWDVEISGHTVVFERDHPNGLFDYAYHPEHPPTDVDHIRAMSIYADTVIIREPLHFPQTRVTIFARELRFEDTGDTPAFLKTTPLAKGGFAAANGEHGHDAGDITLHVAALYSPSSPQPRFQLDGGRGQDPFQGSNGADGINSWTLYGSTRVDVVGCASSPALYTFPDDGIVYVYHSMTWCGSDPLAADREHGVKWENRTQLDGKPAVKAGVPGDGGHAGQLRAPFDIGAVSSSEGGRAGNRGPYRWGGSAGGPNPARWVWIRFNSCFCNLSFSGYRVDHEYTPSRGKSEVAPSPALGPGEPTVPTIDLEPLNWLHPYAVRAVLHYAKDAYLNGHLDVVRNTLEPYAAALRVLVTLGDEELLVEGVSPQELLQLEQEVATLLHRLDSLLDYFGNPPGWVPMLSFEVLLSTFEQEVEAAGQLLYLANYLAGKAEAALEAREAIARMDQELRAEILQFEEELGTREPRDGALGTILDLQDDAESILREIDAREVDLRNRRNDLISQAGLNVAIRSALRIAGNIVQMIPIPGVPFEAVGKGLQQASGPSETPSVNLFDVFVAGVGSGIPAGIEAFQSADTEDKPSQSAVVAESVLSGINATFSNMAAVDRVMQAELDTLVAQDPESIGIVESITELNQRKQLYAETLLTELQRAQDLMNGITQNHLALDSLSRTANENNNRIDQDAFRYVKELEQRAKDRLLKYQYYVGKAYEYRTVRPYSDVGNYQLQQVYDFFIDQSFPDSAEDPLLPDTALRGSDGLIVLYTDLLRGITAEIIDYLNEGSEQRDFRTYELSAAELERLNMPPYQVRINLVDSGQLFFRTQENLRVFYLGVQPGTDGLGNMSVSARGGGSPASVSVLVHHSGESRIRSLGETYRFAHYKTLENRPISWRLTYDAATDTVTSPELSPRTASLLEALLGSGIEDLLLYSRPGANADLILTKEVASEDVDMVVDKLKLFVEFDYYEKKRFQSDLEVKAVNEEGDVLMAPIRVDQIDDNGRRDGLGKFLRVFRLGEIVTVEAPQYYGAYEFRHWVDRSGFELGQNLSLDLVLPSNQLGTPDVVKVRAIYQLGGISTNNLFRRGDANADGTVDISDGVRILHWLFQGVAMPPCLDAADADDNGVHELTDAVRIFNFLFLGGSAPSNPGPHSCGVDPTPDAFGCRSFPSC